MHLCLEGGLAQASLGCLGTNTESLAYKQEELEVYAQSECSDVIRIMKIKWDSAHDWKSVMEAFQRGHGEEWQVHFLTKHPLVYAEVQCETRDLSDRKLLVKSKGKRNMSHAACACQTPLVLGDDDVDNAVYK